MIVKIYSIFCDGISDDNERHHADDCEGWIAEEKKLTEAMKIARSSGWLVSGNKALSPACLESVKR